MKIRLHIVMMFTFSLFYVVNATALSSTICDNNAVGISLELKYIRTFDISDNNLVISSENNLYFVDYTTQQMVSEQIFQDTSFVQVVEFDPEGNRYAVLHNASRDDGTDTIDTLLEIRDSATHTSLFTVSLAQQNSYPSVSWSPDGKYIALVGKMTGANGESVRVWDIATKEEVFSHQGKDIFNPYTQLADWSPDGQLFAYADNTEIYIWNTEDWTRFALLDTRFVTQISSVSWINNDLMNLLVTSGRIEIIDRWSGAIVDSWSRITQDVRIAKASPNVQWIAQGGRNLDFQKSSESGGIVIRDLDTQGIVHVLEAHQNEVFDVEWTSDSQTVFSASSDSIYQWDVDSGCGIFEIKLERE